jgi:tetratricopeptide (TPR) repeat protein
VFLLTLFLFSLRAAECSAQAHTPRRTSREAARVNTAQAELQARVRAAEEARQAGDPSAIGQANRRLIALAFRQLAHLRLIEGDTAKAAELYGQSLSFEEAPETRVDLAVSYLRARRPDESLAEASKVVLADSENARAWHIQGKAWMMKREYARAAESLSRANALQWDPDAAYSQAICLLAIPEKEEAAAVFEQMAKAAPGNLGTLHVLFARAYRDAGFLPDAIRELNTALRIDPNTPNAHYFLGLVYLLEEEWAPNAEIRKQFQQELRLNPQHFLANYLLGAVESGARNYETSDRYLKVAARIDPAWPEPWIYLGLNAAGRGDHRNAEMFLRKAIARTGKDEARSNYFVRKAYFALGRILRDSDRGEEGRALLHKAGELQQRVQEKGQQDMARHGVPMGSSTPPEPQRPEEAIPVLEETDVRAGDPVNTAAQEGDHLDERQKRAADIQERRLRAVLGAGFNDLATAEATSGDFRLAFDHYEQAQRWDPELPGLRRNLGVAAAKAGNYEAAVRVLPFVIKANFNDRPARAMLGLSQYMTERYSEAVETLASLGEAAENDPVLGYALADAYAKVGRYSKAGRALEKLQGKILGPDALMLVGKTWEDTGNHTRAVEVFHRVLELDPKRKKAHYNAGLSYIRADRPAEAAAEFEAELAVSPEDADAKYNLGFSLLQQSKAEAAAALFREVIAADPQHAEANYQLGKMLLDEGRAGEALPYLEQAARQSPEKDYVHYQLQAAYRKQSRLEDAERELNLYKEIKARKRAMPRVPSPPEQ